MRLQREELVWDGYVHQYQESLCLADACHRRKVKCSGSQPCTTCEQSSLRCTYNLPQQKKGPKGTRAKVISELRVEQQNPDLKGSGSDLNGTPSSSLNFASPPTSPAFRPLELLPQPLMRDCIDVFFSSMYPTMPILHPIWIQEQAAAVQGSVETFCLVGSLCAFMMVQPGTKNPGPFAMDPAAVKERCHTATILIDEITRARKTYDYIEAPNLDAIRTSFFLYGAYFNLDRHNASWYHLREATTLAQTVGMHQDDKYMDEDPTPAILRRRMYWLLFLTERAYALERHRPLTLHATITQPGLNEIPSESSTISGFLHMIRLWEALDDKFVDMWNKARSYWSPGDVSAPWLADQQRRLRQALPPTIECTESQAADIRVTQQWLRTIVWQMSIAKGLVSSNSMDIAMTFKYPIDIARDLIKDISVLSSAALEVHGIGLIEKLFDIACTLTDVIAFVPQEHDQSVLPPEDCLNQLLTLIAQLRGGDSRFLPLLIEKIQENLPLLTTPVPFKRLLNSTDDGSTAGPPVTSPTFSSKSAPLARRTDVSPASRLTPAFTEPTLASRSPPVPDGPWEMARLPDLLPRSIPQPQGGLHRGRFG